MLKSVFISALGPAEVVKCAKPSLLTNGRVSHTVSGPKASDTLPHWGKTGRSISDRRLLAARVKDPSGFGNWGGLDNVSPPALEK